MNEFEICKRIAEIEGIDDHVFERWKLIRLVDGSESHYEHYNPLSDKTLCFDLMIKHNISVDPRSDGRIQAFMHCHSSRCVTKEDPQMAICLAIIKKHSN